MTDGVVQLPADGAGKKLHTKDMGATLGHEQVVRFGADKTYYIWTGALALAANKYFLALLNNAGSNQIVKIRKMFLVNAALAAVAGVGVEFNLRRISAIVGGTAVTPNPADTADGAASGITCVHTPTSVVEGTLLFPWFTNNDEIGLTGGFPQATIQALESLLIEGPEVKELTLRAGEGMCFKQITSSVIGSMGVLAAITVEAV